MNDNMFMTEFLLLSDVRTWIFIGILIVLFGVINRFEKKKVKFSTRMIAGTIIGFALGVMIQWVAGFPSVPGDVKWLSEVSSWYGLVGNGFMDLLKMLVVPLVFLSIVKVIMNMQGENLG